METNALFAALSKAQSAMRAAELDKANPHFKSRYASLASVWDAIRKPLTDNGLAITQTFSTADSRLLMLTKLTHASGQCLESVYPIDPIRNDPQGIGSAITYARRYSISAIVGLTADEDDDGNAASPTPSKRPEAKATPAPAPVMPSPKVEKPKAKAAVPLDDERKALFGRISARVEAKAWSYEQLKEYTKTAFSVEASNELSTAQLDQLAYVCGMSTPEQAFAELKASKNEDVL